MGLLSSYVDRARVIVAAASKRLRKIRRAEEFAGARLLPLVRSPAVPATSTYGWDLESIRTAREAQKIGRFAQAVRLAEDMRTDDALFVAYQNRLAPQRCLSVEILRGKGGGIAGTAAAEAEALFGKEGIALHPDTMSDIVGCMANHGVAFAVNVWNPRQDGSRVDVELRFWPAEFVWWNSSARCWQTRIDPYPNVNPTIFGVPNPPSMTDAYAHLQPEHGYATVPIVHGDGRWCVFQKHDFLPFRQDAAILPAALVWARHAFALRDWAKGSASHGNAKVIGELPEGFSLQSSEDDLTTEANAFLELLKGIAADDSPVGIKPFGAKIDYLTNSSRAWEVWRELITNAEKAAARIYLGTDGVLGTQGGAPGVDISQLFGVASTIVQGDVEALQRGIATGVIEPWCAINYGDSSCAPTRRYMLPDRDADEARAAFAQRTKVFCETIAGLRAAGLSPTQEIVDDIADRLGVPTVPLAQPAT